MKRVATFIFIVTVLLSTQTFGQYPPFTKWYQNPLGFSPVNLHTANGIIIPAVAATAILLLTKNDKTSANRFSYYDDIGVSYGYYASKNNRLSNGNNPSYDRNPGHDSNGFSVGLIYKPNNE